MAASMAMAWRRHQPAAKISGQRGEISSIENMAAAAGGNGVMA
jgi:hypothetical protein